MLHQHLQRLEQPLDGEEILETAHSLKSEEEIESDHDVEGMLPFHFVWLFDVVF